MKLPTKLEAVPWIACCALILVLAGCSSLDRELARARNLPPGQYQIVHPPTGEAEQARLKIEAEIQRVPATELMEARTHRSPAGTTMPYRLFMPKKGTSPEASGYPLVVYLHHAGQTGTDNLKHIRHDRSPDKTDWGVGVFLLNQAKHPCIIVAPQVPEQKAWAYMSWGQPKSPRPAEMNEYMRMAFEIVDGLLAACPIDCGRIYVTGASMGGFGTFEAVSRRPHFFAAAVPICGGHDEACAPLLVDTPVWAFHGDHDEMISVQRTRNMIDAIRAAGGKPIYWEYAGVSHTFVRDLAYDDPRLIEWIFRQHRHVQPTTTQLKRTP